MGLREVFEQFDWEGYLDDHYEWKDGTNGELRINCPSCGETKLKCYVNPEKGVFHCFKCEFSSGEYNLFDFIAVTEGISRGAAINKLLIEYTPTTPTELTESFFHEYAAPEGSTDLRVLSGMPKGCVLLSHGNHPLAKPFWDYLIGRGLTAKEIVAMKTYFCPFKNRKLHNRVVWPVYGGNQDLISWVSRSIDPKVEFQRYLNCPDSDVKKTLWPYIMPTEKRIILVEGMLDCMSVRRLYPNVYATLSKSLTEAQLLLMHHWGVEEVILFWDKKDATAAMLSVQNRLKMLFKSVYLANFAGWKDDMLDAGDALVYPHLVEEIQFAIDNAVDVESLEFLAWQLS